MAASRHGQQGKGAVVRNALFSAAMSVRPIHPGSLVDIVAPSGPFDADRLRAGIAWLESIGLRCRHREDLFARDRFLAGPDDRRAAELIDALRAPDSDLVWAARGGYGASRIVERIDPALVRAAGKQLVGFSDLTTLHAAWRKAGVPSIHGPMVARLAAEPEETRARLLQLLFEGAMAPIRGESLVPGEAHGVLSGGNLALLAASCGTRWQPELRGAIVFLEDVGERPYRLDRMMVQCRQAGLFDGVAGIALGEFTDCAEKDGSSTSAQVLEEQVRALGVPAIRGLPCGHGEVNWPLPLGHAVRLDGARGLLTMPGVSA